MPARQNNVAGLIVIAVGTAIGLGMLAFIGNNSFWAPWSAACDLRDEALKEYQKKQLELAEFNKKKMKLAQARLKGLPGKGTGGVNEYRSYLNDLTRKMNEKETTINDPSVGVEVKSAAQANKKLTPGHVIRTWTVRTKGKWLNIVKMLEEFERTPLQHRIKSLSIERPAGSSDKKSAYEFKKGELTLAMTIEVMVVGRSDKRTNLWGVHEKVIEWDTVAALGKGITGWSMLLRNQSLLIPEMPAGRDYKVLDYWDPFFGGLTKAQTDEIFPPKKTPPVTPPAPPPEVDKGEDYTDPIDGEDIRKRVRLTMNTEVVKTLKVEVKPTPSVSVFSSQAPPTSSDKPLAVQDGETVELFLGKTDAAELAVKFATGKADRKSDCQLMILPADSGVTARISTEDRTIKITAGEKTRPGIYMVELKVRKAVLRKFFVDPSSPDAYITLSTGFGYNTITVRGEGGTTQASGKVIRIDHYGVYFTNPSGKGIFFLRNGGTIYDALRLDSQGQNPRPFTAAELQQLDWWALSPLSASTLGLLGSPGPAPWLATFALSPDRPGLRPPPTFRAPQETVESEGKVGTIGTER